MEKESKKKNIVQDVVPPKRSIRNINIPSRRRLLSEVSISSDIQPPRTENHVQSDYISAEKTPKQTNHAQTLNNLKPEISSQEPPAYSYEYATEHTKSSKKGLYVAIGIFVVALAFGISALFKSATITITPRHQTYNLNSVFTAKKDDTGNNLAFQVVTITKNLQKTVPATGEANVQNKARGTIIIFNNYSTSSQKLVATTRFQTPEGLIFRLVSATTVPGIQTKAGSTIPGSVEAVVVADAAGDKYNVSLKDFVIPGFKGDPRYSKIYARSKTMMTGGFSGLQKIVSTDVASTTDSELEDNLKISLATDITSQIPSNFVLYDGGLSYSFSPTTQVDSTDSGAVLQKSGTAYAIIFDKGSLSREIISNILPDSTNDVIKITNLEKLVLSYPDGKSFDPTSGNTTLNFNLSGEANLVWVFDENKLKSDLLGLSKTQAHEAISKYSSITEVWLETRPFWNQIIPTDPNKVKLINTLAQ